MMKVEIRNNKIIIDGYVNAVERESKVLYDTRGEFIEKIRAGVFQKALERADNVKVLLDHEKDRELADTKSGKAKLYEDNIGLRAIVEIDDSEVIEKARNNKLRGWSFGFLCNKEDRKTNEDGIEERVVRDLDLLEVSIIDDKKYPAYIGTSIEMRDDKVRIAEYRNEDFSKIEIRDEPEQQPEKEVEKIDYSEYEERLKDLRYKLRNSYYEEEILEEAKYLEDNPSEKNLKKINKLIDKLDNYKEKINTETKFEIEENFIIALVEEDKEEIKKLEIDINDSKSEVLRSIDFKVEEIKQIEENVKEKVEQQKILKNIDEEKIIDLKESKEEVNKFSNELIKFQDEQDKIVKEVQKEIKKEENKSSKERIQLNGIGLSTALTMRNVRRQMRVPGIRSSKKIFTIVGSYLYYFSMLNAIRPIKRKYKKVSREDFSKDIETNLIEIDKVLENIKKTNNKIEKIIKEFTIKYGKYENTEEYKKIMNNFKEIQKALLEKEYEIQRIKEEEQKRYQKEQEQSKVYKI